jgi:hypothetical protein
MEEKVLNQAPTEQAQATASEQVQDTVVKSPYKVFDDEDTYKKEVQSVASKAKYELLEKTGEKSVEAIKAKFAELETVKNELKSLSEIKNQLEQSKKEKQNLEENLLMTKLGIKTELQSDFLTLAKTRLESAGDLTNAMTQTLEKYSYFKGNESPMVKIGTEKKPSNVDLGDEELQRLVKKYPHLKF